eukprot:10915272-Heterocapsa_arctica.AAC.1
MDINVLIPLIMARQTLASSWSVALVEPKLSKLRTPAPHGRQVAGLLVKEGTPSFTQGCEVGGLQHQAGLFPEFPHLLPHHVEIRPQHVQLRTSEGMRPWHNLETHLVILEI